MLLVYFPICENKCPYPQLPEVCSVQVTAQALVPGESTKAACHQLEVCPRLALRPSSAGPSPACVTANGDLLWTPCPLSHQPCSLTLCFGSGTAFCLEGAFSLKILLSIQSRQTPGLRSFRPLCLVTPASSRQPRTEVDTGYLCGHPPLCGDCFEGARG